VRRYAAIDVGTNSVLLLVAEKDSDNRWSSVFERAEITRLGRGVDASRRLAPESIAATVAAIEGFVRDAALHEASEIVVSATSAARDAVNGAEFLELTRQRAGVTVEIISGAEEARLSFASAHADFGGDSPLVVVDIGGGSTELIFGDRSGAISFRHSFDVGAVRLTERLVKNDPPHPHELAQIEQVLTETFATLPAPSAGTRLVGVAGTVTTVAAIVRRVEPYDPTVVHGLELTREEIDQTVTRLQQLPLALRRSLPGLQPKRADVVVAGAMVLRAVVSRIGAKNCTVSDRGLRWGLLADRFGAAS